MNAVTEAAGGLLVACPQCHSLVRVPEARAGEHPKCPRCKAPLLAGEPVALDAAGFLAHVQRATLPVLVDFWAPWCGPCKMMAPHFAQAASQLEPQVRLVKVDTDQEQALGARYGIRSIPTLMLFRGGREIAREAGAMNSAGIVQWVRGNGA